MNATQLKMARAALGWGVRELAARAGVTANTVTRIENGNDAKASTLAALQSALEEAGLHFIPENGGGAGVRLRRPDTGSNRLASEANLRRRAKRLDWRIEKGRGPLHFNNKGLYQLINDRNVVIGGVDYDASLEDIDHWIDAEEQNRRCLDSEDKIDSAK